MKTIVLQPVLTDAKNPSQMTPSKLKPQLELNEVDFLAVADYGRAVNVDGESVTSYWFNRSRYIVWEEVEQ